MVQSMIKLHIAIAWLWGAPKHPKARELPMSGELVVDHIMEGNTRDWRVENLQFTTQAHNIQKAMASGANTSGYTTAANTYPEVRVLRPATCPCARGRPGCLPDAAP